MTKKAKFRGFYTTPVAWVRWKRLLGKLTIWHAMRGYKTLCGHQVSPDWEVDRAWAPTHKEPRCGVCSRAAGRKP